MKIKLEARHKTHCLGIGHPAPPDEIEVSEKEYMDAVLDWQRTYPHLTGEELDMRAVAHVLWGRHARGETPASLNPPQIPDAPDRQLAPLLAIPPKPKEEPKGTFNWWKWLALALAFLLLLLFARPAHAQFSHINTIDFRNNDNSAQGFITSPFVFKAGANCGWSRSGTTMTFNCSGGSAAAGGLDTQVQYNSATALAGITNMTSDGTNVTKLTATGNIDLSGATFTRLRVAAGLTAAANGEIGYDSTDGNWHAWNGADKIIALLSGAFTTGHCGQISKVGNKLVVVDSGGACGGGGISGLTTGFIPKAASATTLADSLLDDGITTANTATYAGTGGVAAVTFKASTANGGISSVEGTGANCDGTAGNDCIYPDSTAHRMKAKNNGAAATTYALFSDNLSVFASTTSAQLRGVLSDETGTGAAYFQGGDIGTPSAGVGTNFTGIPISTGISGLGASVATFLATASSANLRAALTDESGTGAAYFQGGDIGTPSAGVGTNFTGIPFSGVITRPWSCQTGIGDGVNAFTSASYLQTFCFNDTGSTITITGAKCYADAGTPTLNFTKYNSASHTAILTGAVTCTTTWAAATLSGSPTLANGDWLEFTFASGATAKQASWEVQGTY